MQLLRRQQRRNTLLFTNALLPACRKQIPGFARMEEALSDCTAAVGGPAPAPAVPVRGKLEPVSEQRSNHPNPVGPGVPPSKLGQQAPRQWQQQQRAQQLRRY